MLLLVVLLIILAPILLISNKEYLSYEPKLWNTFSNKRLNNCYNYSLDKLETGNKVKPYPGYYKGLPEDYQYTCENLEPRLLADVSIRKVDKDEKCDHKIVMVVDSEGNNKDFHFYRLDETGTWSHKLGENDVLNHDVDGKLIIDPSTANRDYTKNGDENTGYNYNTICGYYCVTK